MKRILLITLIFTALSSSSNAQRLQHILFERWTGSEWVNKVQQSHFYDESNRLEITKLDAWVEAEGEWINQSKTIYIRNSSGKMGTHLTQSWNVEASNWEDTYRSTFSYDETNHPSIVLRESFTSGTWIDQSRDVYTYDENGQVLIRTTETWDETTMNWRNQRQYDYTRTEGTMTSYIIRNWNIKTNAWENYTKADYVIEEGKKTSVIIYSKWEKDAWKLDSKRYNVYEEDVHISADTEIFNEATGEWVNSNHITYIENEDGKIHQCTTHRWDVAENVWNKVQRATYTYSQGEVAAAEELSPEEMIELSIYPNPAKNNITIEKLPKGKIQIVNLAGQIVMSIEDNQSEKLQLDISRYEMGTYLILHEGKKVDKFVKL